MIKKEFKKEECFFCKISDMENRIIFKNKSFYSIFTTSPYSPGHAKIMPIGHIVSIRRFSNRKCAPLIQQFAQLSAR